MLEDEAKKKHLALRIFWSNLRFMPRTEQEPGTSWLELFALWQASAGVEERPDLLERRPTFNYAF